MEINFGAEDLRPLVQEIVRETLAELRSDDDCLPPDRLCLSEAEAAALLGVRPHTLRDERLRGRIAASVVGKRIVYTRHDLAEYLQRRRWTAK